MCVLGISSYCDNVPLLTCRGPVVSRSILSGLGGVPPILALCSCAVQFRISSRNAPGSPANMIDRAECRLDKAEVIKTSGLVDDDAAREDASSFEYQDSLPSIRGVKGGMGGDPTFVMVVGDAG